RDQAAYGHSVAQLEVAVDRTADAVGDALPRLETPLGLGEFEPGAHDPHLAPHERLERVHEVGVVEFAVLAAIERGGLAVVAHGRRDVALARSDAAGRVAEDEPFEE